MKTRTLVVALCQLFLLCASSRMGMAKERIEQYVRVEHLTADPDAVPGTPLAPREVRFKDYVMEVVARPMRLLQENQYTGDEISDLPQLILKEVEILFKSIRIRSADPEEYRYVVKAQQDGDVHHRQGLKGTAKDGNQRPTNTLADLHLEIAQGMVSASQSLSASSASYYKSRAVYGAHVIINVEFRDFNTKELLEGYRVEVVWPRDAARASSIYFNPDPLVSAIFGTSGQLSNLLREYLPRRKTESVTQQEDPLLIGQAIHVGMVALAQELASTDPRKGLKSFDEEHVQIDQDLATSTNGITGKKGEK